MQFKFAIGLFFALLQAERQTRKNVKQNVKTAKRQVVKVQNVKQYVKHAKRQAVRKHAKRQKEVGTTKKSAYRIFTLAIVVLLFVLALVAFAGITFAWFANNWQSKNFPFQADKLELPNFKMWTSTVNDDTIVWNEIHNQDNDQYKVKKADITENGANYSITLNTLHFGTIDNVFQLDEDNYIYMCFKLNSELHGKESMTLHISYATAEETGSTETPYYPFTLYGKKGGIDMSDNTFALLPYNEDNAKLYEQLDALNNIDATDSTKSTSILKYAYYVDTDPTHTDFIAPNGTGFPKDADFSQNYKNFGEDTTLPNETTQIPTGDYYLYVRLNPNKELVADMASVLNSCMPAVILFSVSISLEVR